MPLEIRELPLFTWRSKERSAYAASKDPLTGGWDVAPAPEPGSFGNDCKPTVDTLTKPDHSLYMGADDTREDLDDVALVLVHGIGAQLRGATLVEWAEPITLRLDMIARKKGGRARVTRSVLNGEGPAEVRVTVDRPGQAARSIIITEARWAEEFVEQRPGPVIWWSVRFSLRAARRAATHFTRFGQAMRSSASINATLISKTRWAQIVASRLAHALFVIPLVACILLLLLPIGLATAIAGLFILTVMSHVPFIRAKVNPLIQALTSTIGDAATWTDHPVNAAAIRDVVGDGIRQAGRSAREVIVLGHSQGAAASVEAILAPDTDPDLKVNKLVTVGGAVLLLRSPRWQSRDREQHFDPVQSWLAKPDLHWINVWALWDPVSSGPITTHPKDGKYRWAECYIASLEARMRYLKRRRGSTVIGDTSQIVPGGDHSLLEKHIDPDRECVGPEEWPVHNRCSLIRDHVTYTSNIIQVIDPLAYQLLGEAMPVERFILGGDAVSRPASTWVQQTMVRLLAWTKAIALILAVLLAPPIVEAFSGRPWLGILGEASRTLDEGLGKFFDWLIRTGLGHALELGLAAAAIFFAINSIATGFYVWANHINTWASPSTNSKGVHYLPFVTQLPLSFLAILEMLLFVYVGFIISSGISPAQGTIWPLPTGVAGVMVTTIVMAIAIAIASLPWFGARPFPIPARRKVDARSSTAASREGTAAASRTATASVTNTGRDEGAQR